MPAPNEWSLIVGAGVQLAATAAGASVLALPLAFSESGIAVALGVTFLVAVLTVVSFRYLVVAIEVLDLWSFEDIARQLLGPWSEAVIRWTVIFASWGSCAGYVVVIGEMLAPLRNHWLPRSSFPVPDVVVTLGFCFVVLLPLAQIRHSRSLNGFSFLGYSSVLFTVFAVVFRYFFPRVLRCGFSEVGAAGQLHNHHQQHQQHQSGHDDLGFVVNPCLPHQPPVVLRYCNFSLSGFLAISALSFAYDAQMLVYQSYSGLRAALDSVSAPVAMHKATIIMTLLCTVTYVSIGLFGYLTLGSTRVRPDILQNYDPNEDPLFAAAYACFAVSLSITFAILIHPLRDAFFIRFYGVTLASPQQDSSAPSGLVDSAFEERAASEVAPGVSNAMFTCWSTVLALSAILIGVFIPNFAVIVAIIGGPPASLMCYIFPAAFVLRLHQLGARKMAPSDTFLAWGMLAFGVVGGILGLISGVQVALSF